MAITTPEKRQSAAGAGFPWSRGVFPQATPTESWRMSVGHAYGGNALSPGGRQVEGLEYTLPKNRLHFNVPGRPLDYTIPKGRGHFTGKGEDQ